MVKRILQKYLFFILCLSFIINVHSDEPCSDFSYQWAIAGAGPAGIIAIGVLLDQGIPAKKIIWFDPTFNVGRLGEYYRNVPANSRAKEMSALVKGCNSFNQCSSGSIDILHQCSPYIDFYLRMIADPLKDITFHFFQCGVTPIFAPVTDLITENSTWQIYAQNHCYNARNVILAIGAEPLELDYQGPTTIPLDKALDKNTLATLIEQDDTIAVVGSGASALLILKYLSEMPVKKVINFYKHHHSQARKRSLIRGETAKWVKDILDKTPPANLLRVYNTPEQRALHLPLCNKIIYASGYKRNPLPHIVGMYAPETPNKTGILGPHLYGLGFAFPEELTYMSAQGLVKVPLVGLTSFMNFAKRVMPEWLKEN